MQMLLFTKCKSNTLSFQLMLWHQKTDTIVGFAVTIWNRLLGNSGMPGRNTASWGIWEGSRGKN